MCGIAGYFCFGELRPDKAELTQLMASLESRGKDATGFAYLDETNQLVVHKEPIKSSQFVKENISWVNLEILPDKMIMHARAATKGASTNNMNNHPLYTKEGVCIVHNGVISNDDFILRNMQRDAQVDSEAVLRLIASEEQDHKKRVERVFDKLMGSFAVACIDARYPDKMFLFKKSNPIEILYDPQKDILYFASTKSMLKSIYIEETIKRGMTIKAPVFEKDMSDNMFIVIGKEGVEGIHQIKTSYIHSYPSYRSGSYYNNSGVTVYGGNKGVAAESRFTNGNFVYNTLKNVKPNYFSMIMRRTCEQVLNSISITRFGKPDLLKIKSYNRKAVNKLKGEKHLYYAPDWTKDGYKFYELNDNIESLIAAFKRSFCMLCSDDVQIFGMMPNNVIGKSIVILLHSPRSSTYRWMTIPWSANWMLTSWNNVRNNSEYDLLEKRMLDTNSVHNDSPFSKDEIPGKDLLSTIGLICDEHMKFPDNNVRKGLSKGAELFIKGIVEYGVVYKKYVMQELTVCAKHMLEPADYGYGEQQNNLRSKHFFSALLRSIHEVNEIEFGKNRAIVNVFHENIGAGRTDPDWFSDPFTRTASRIAIVSNNGTTVSVICQKCGDLNDLLPQADPVADPKCSYCGYHITGFSDISDVEFHKGVGSVFLVNVSDKVCSTNRIRRMIMMDIIDKFSRNIFKDITETAEWLNNY